MLVVRHNPKNNTRVVVILSFFLTKVVDFCPVSFGVAPEDRDLPRSNARGKPVGEELKKKTKTERTGKKGEFRAWKPIRRDKEDSAT